MDVLFTLAHWHALAKLRQHTDLSLDVLKSVTVQLGNLLRNFQEKTCTAYDTQELKREATARIHKTAKKMSTTKAKTETKTKTSNSQAIASPSKVVVSDTVSLSLSPLPGKPASSSPKKEIKSKLRRTLNLNTYKDHSLGDYVDSIRRNGTIDSYSTEIVNSHNIYTCILQVLT